MKGRDLAASIRGPDPDYPKLKYIITGWIRAKVGMENYCGVLRHKELTTHDIRKAEREVKRLCGREHHHQPMTHWACHAIRAIRWLRESLTDPVGRREDGLTCALLGMLGHPTTINRDRVLRYLDDWLEPPKIQVYDVGNTHQRR